MTKTKTAKAKKPTGYVVYEGPSALTREPIVAVVTLKSDNGKTGDMAQLWIIANGDEKPSDALKTGGDKAVCGDCPFAGGKGCYVNVGQAPNAVYRTAKAGKYPHGMPPATPKAIRLGAYGDPAALPFEVIAELLRRFDGHTGYTHSWKTCDARLQGVVMASVETAETTAAATQAGWRTARVAPDATLAANEFLCPATTEGGKRTTCEACQLCNGKSAMSTPKGVVFPAHGSRKSTALIQIGVAA